MVITSEGDNLSNFWLDDMRLCVDFIGYRIGDRFMQPSMDKQDENAQCEESSGRGTASSFRRALLEARAHTAH